MSGNLQPVVTLKEYLSAIKEQHESRSRLRKGSFVASKEVDVHGSQNLRTIESKTMNTYDVPSTLP
jgi:hypothetical protein